jgi:hypothetical protein
MNKNKREIIVSRPSFDKNNKHIVSANNHKQSV